MDSLLTAVSDLTGFSKMQLMAVICVAVIIFGIYFCGRQFGLFENITISQSSLDAHEIVYVSHRSAYENVGVVFDKIKNDSEGIL